MHLSRKQVPSPFTSLFRSWESAVQQRHRLMNGGALKVLIIAIWLEDRVVYDAENIAKSLGYVECPAAPDEETRPLHLHTDEIFITGGISPSENRILATFGEEEKKDGKEQREIELVPISKLISEEEKLLSVLVAKEIDLEECIGKSEITKLLASELRRRTGVLDY
ncbi:hypothetical protein FPANT_6456 [Fusarium pseudoanthophilum]|uniref:Uncharacterized protein n=1 Tax=Fusarium pseudoanthophilum TaxID=48495 RepID=A0A8H5LDX4_9HYPO|nr:hypothetical protein FPANT_6456 [Fusarium pseudoanthophilum]